MERWTAPLGGIGVVVLAAACGPRLSSGVMAAHPPIALTVVRPQVVAASAEGRPPWLSGFRTPSPEAVELVGQGSGRSRKAAEGAADRDLFAAVARYFSASVQSELEVDEHYRSRDGAVESGISARSEQHVQTGESLARLEPDGRYWEQVETPGQDPVFRAFVHATVPRASLERGARLARLRGATLVVVLPFGDAPAARALYGEVVDRLGPARGYTLCPPSLVGALLPVEREQQQAAARALFSPRVIVSGELRELPAGLEVTWALHHGGREERLGGGRLVSGAGDLFALQDDLVDALGRDLAEALARGGGGERP